MVTYVPNNPNFGYPSQLSPESTRRPWPSGYLATLPAVQQGTPPSGSSPVRHQTNSPHPVARMDQEKYIASLRQELQQQMMTELMSKLTDRWTLSLSLSIPSLTSSEGVSPAASISRARTWSTRSRAVSRTVSTGTWRPWGSSTRRCRRETRPSDCSLVLEFDFRVLLRSKCWNLNGIVTFLS